MKNKQLPRHFEIKVGMHGVGAFITKDIKKGTVLFKMKGKIINHPTRTSVQVSKHQHIEDLLAGHINHSCTPNARVSRRARTFVSLRNIKKGEEITFDYNKNEDELAAPFVCICCGQKIAGKKINLMETKPKILTTP